jgi:16S rRNA (cytosine967-C5)-methyltransferase
LLDAPCTGSGILRRNPDTKWRMVDCEAFSQLQANLLRQSAAFVAPGGTLLYVTCALERWQNEAVVEAFLNSTLGANFTLEPLAPDFPNRTPGLFLRTWPHLHNLDAFFLARLRRT